MNHAEERYDWKRFWCPRDGRMEQDGTGFLADPELNPEPIRWTDVVPFEAIDDKPCLLLLGEPGIGKSDAMEELRKAAQASPTHGEKQLFVDLRFKRRPRKELFGAPEFKRWQKGASPLLLFIDSLDECSNKEIAQEIIGHLSEGPRDKLRLRIACRTAELPPFLEGKLRELWGDQAKVGVYELAPLRRKDVEQAAGTHAERFLAEVERREAASLAIKPVTLRFLLSQFRKHEVLPRTRWELYREGCRILCEEASKTRSKGELNGAARMAVAARIAAVCILGRRTAIQLEPALDELPPGLVLADALVGETERVPRGDVQVDDLAVRKTLDTSLFNGRDAGLGFAHQTYAEFLAAYFLHQRGLGPEDLEGVLLQGGHVVPELREVAAWLASVDAGVFQKLLREEPQVLLRSDMAMVGDAERERLVEGLFQRIEAHELSDLDVRLEYGKLVHARLASQLEPRIRDRTSNAMIRRAAMRIAEACKERGLQTALADMTLDVEEETRMRAWAASIVAEIGDDAVLEKLRPLAHGKGGEDPEDELKASALLALWPRLMSARELFECLRPAKRQNYFGDYIGRFFGRPEMDHLGDDDLPEALAWVERQSPHPERYASISIISNEIIQRAWARTNKPKVLGALVRLARTRFARHQNLFENRGAGVKQLGHTALRQRRFVRAFVESTPPLTHEYGTLRSQGLMPPHPILWMLKQLKAASSPAMRTRWSELIAEAWCYPAPPVHEVEALIRARRRYPELAQALGPYFLRMDVEDPEVQQARARWLEHQRKDKEQEEEWRAQRVELLPEKEIAECLDRIEAGKLGEFWWLQRVMAEDANGNFYRAWMQPDLTSSPGWQKATSDTRRRIVRVAQRYLLRRRSKPGKWLGENVIYWPDVAGYRALWLLRQERPDWFERLTGRTWRRWAPIVMGYRPALARQSDIDVRNELVARAYRLAPEETLWTLGFLIDSENAAGNSYPESAQAVDFCWGERIGALLLAKAQDPSLKPSFSGSLLSQCLQHGTAGARAHAMSLLRLPIPDDPDHRERAKFAAAALFTHSADAGWPVLWPILQADPAFGQEIMLAAAQRVNWYNSPLWQRLPEDDAANAYIWLKQQFPHDADAQRRRVVTPETKIVEARDALLKNLRQRGTPASVAAIQRIMQALPGEAWISRVLAEAREITRQQTWTPLSPEQVIALKPKPPAASDLKTTRPTIALDLPPGSLFAGRYRIIRPIAKGGMGEVFEVEDERIKRLLALKVLDSIILEDGRSRARFDTELTAIGRVESEHVVRVLDGGVEKDSDGREKTPYLVTELVKGEDLDAFIARHPNGLATQTVLAYLRDVARGLEKVHAEGIVHRDLKPANLVLATRDDGRSCVKILDFGIAKVIKRDGPSEKTEGGLGTPPYMAPEAQRREGVVDARTDVFALGHIARRLLAGSRRWTTAPELGLPAGFDTWFQKITAMQPDARFDSAMKAVDALEEALHARGAAES